MIFFKTYDFFIKLMASVKNSVIARWALFLSVSAVVLYAIFRPAPIPAFFGHAGTIDHVVAFLALAVTARMVFLMLPKIGFWLAMLVTAFILEYLQGVIRPLRLFDMYDVYANLIGVLLAMAFMELFSRDVLRARRLRRVP
ncbi:MAG: hypothetical protein V7721_00775 [Porticoccaceae bacterium]